MSEPNQPSLPALAGVRVLDLTHQIAGPSATLALALMGADVVKVVPPGVTDSYDNLAFFLNNVNKRSIVLDMKSPDGQAAFLDLVDVADICIENWAPGVAERLGVTYDALKARNPRLIFAQIKGFDAEGPYAGYPAFDPVAQAFSGPTSITGSDDGPPVKCGPDFGDTGTGMLMASGILAALYQRTQTGTGQHVRIAMSDQIATSLRISYPWPIERGIATPRFGNRPPFIQPVAPSDLYHCAPFGSNDYLHIHCGNDKQWARMATAIGRPDLIDDARTATLEIRAENVDFVNGVVAAWAGTVTKYEGMRILGEAGVPAGAVRDTKEIMDDPDMHARGIFGTVQHARLGEVTAIGWPIRMSDSHVPLASPSLPGADTAEVFADWLGAARAD